MKKLFFPVMLFVAAISSCAKDESSDVDYADATNSGDLVSLNVYAGTAKGVDTTTSTLEDETTTIELHIDDSDGISDTYTFSYSGSDWSQTDAAQLKWSDIVFPANFYSLHDGSAFYNLTFGSGSAIYEDYTVTGVSTDHKDLVFHASKLIAIPTGGVLSAYHKHALSKIDLYAATGDNNVYIAKATLINVSGKGTVTITPLAVDADASEVGASWVCSDSDDDVEDYEYYYIGTSSPVAFNSDTYGSDPLIYADEAPDASMMIIPQTTTAITSDQIADGDLSASYVEVIYYMTSSTGNPLVGYSSVGVRDDYNDYIGTDQTTTLYVKAAFPLGYTFGANKEYTIKLGLGADCSSGGILVDDFYVDKDGNKVELTKKDTSEKETVEIPDIDEGDDILENVNSVIDITVTATDWSTGSSTTLEYTE